MKKNIVSVIIPTYNRDSLIGKAIDSVLNQTYDHVEIVIINDGSTDNTLDVLNNYKAQHPDKIVIINQENFGQVTARNNGIKYSHGEFISFLDSDDQWLPRKIEKQIALFSNGVGLVYGGINEIDESGDFIRAVPCQPDMRGSIYHHLLVKNRMTGGTVVVSREAINKVGLFDPNLKAAENWDLWIRIAKEYTVDFVDEPVMNYRKHSTNMSNNTELMANATQTIFKKHIPIQPEDPELLCAYNKAYSNYYYQLGMHFFAKADYGTARMYYYKIKHHSPLSNSLKISIFRTFLGKQINDLISKLKTTITK